ncbi:MAG: penicillin-binding protein 1C [Bacteroidetes bacterium]|nr:penicillin-binding protein 1C [Bacteroidota bacterium]
MYLFLSFVVKHKTKSIILAIICTYLLFFPFSLKQKPESIVLYDSELNLLSAHVSTHDQWHFESKTKIPFKYKQCLLHFEDKNYYSHIGISFKAIARAVYLNFKHGDEVSGASTITMQSIRISLKNPPRTYFQKIREVLLALRIEVKYTKEEILEYYVANAPFGNNVIGLEAASWRFYGKSSQKLSWAESATMAVLPNAPGLIYPGKNKERLLKKRNKLLQKLKDNKLISQDDYLMAIEEPLPQKPANLPNNAPQLLDFYAKNGFKSGSYETNINGKLQKSILELLSNNGDELSNFNVGILVTDLSSGEIISYIGNNPAIKVEQGKNIDCIHSSRSSGSILKPLLYGLSLDDGLIMPNSLLPDYPSYFGAFTPKNNNLSHQGAVAANVALSRSLNIPMVYLLKSYGVGKFQHKLNEMGISTLNRKSTEYGLSLILGGAEVSLWDLNKTYVSMAMQLNKTSKPLIAIPEMKSIKNKCDISDISIYHTFEAMKALNRPDEEGNWQQYNSAQKIAWKTGTSFGNRDAWSIGLTPKYAVSIWVGNASGEGNPLLSGIKTAAPILFEIFSMLPSNGNWFEKPDSGILERKTCKQSGYIASQYCEDWEMIKTPKYTTQAKICPYHSHDFVSKDEIFCITRKDDLAISGHLKNYLKLPPMMEKYYCKNHPEYEKTPQKFQNKGEADNIKMIYPKPLQHIFIPIKKENTGVFFAEVTHKENTTIYWHLDNFYLGETQHFHQIKINTTDGMHTLLAEDQNGNQESVDFYLNE